MMDRICVVGLGKVGLPLAAVWAEAGFEVRGFDTDEAAVQAMNLHSPRVFEPGLAEALESNRDRVAGFIGLKDAIIGAKLILVVVPTPSLPSGNFDAHHVFEAVAAVHKLNLLFAQDPVVAVVSTVSPGTMSDIRRRFVDRPPRLVYSPTMVALGDAMRTLRFPDWRMAASDDLDVRDELADLLQELAFGISGIYPPPHGPLRPHIIMTSFASGELITLASNAFVCAKIAFANMLAPICSRIGADVGEVTDGLRMDHRIGPWFPQAGMPFGGPCFPRDLAALENMIERVYDWHGDDYLGESSCLPDAINKQNMTTSEEIAGLVIMDQSSMSTKGVRTVCLIGLGYKEDSAIIDASPSLMIADILGGSGWRIVTSDPNAKEDHTGGVELVGLDGIRDADAVILCHRNLVDAPSVMEGIASSNRIGLVVDPWRQIGAAVRERLEYMGKRVIYFGRGAVPGRKRGER